LLDKLVHELIETEKTYVANLKLIVKMFLTPLRADAGTPKEIVPLSSIKVLFSDIEVILNMNTLLLNELSQRQAAWGNVQKIGKISTAILIISC
jgi:hypothetical protein